MASCNTTLSELNQVCRLEPADTPKSSNGNGVRALKWVLGLAGIVGIALFMFEAIRTYEVIQATLARLDHVMKLI